MVVLSSDSNTTLVSLDHERRPRCHERKSNSSKQQQQQQQQQQKRRPQDLLIVHSASPVSVAAVSVRLQPAAPLAPPRSLDDVETAIRLPESSSTVRLALPKNCTSTTFLQRYEALVDQRDVLLAQDVVTFDDHHHAKSETFVHVGQGEMATTASTSCDVLLSDRATTCHILAIWSTCPPPRQNAAGGDGNNNAATTTPGCCSTVAHIDAAGYDASLQSVFAHHDAYHHYSPATVFHVHLIGGFDEEKSHEISMSILHCLATLSTRYCVVLETCVIAALNQDEFLGGPRLRGLALDCRTGRVYPAHCTAPMILGPVRALRLWSRGGGGGSDHKELLQLFSDPNDDILVIPKCTWGRVSSRWNTLSDADLLAQCSTSPEYEDADDFCYHLRHTFGFCNQVTPQEVFGEKSSLAFTRFGRTNRWVPVASKTTTKTLSSSLS